MIKDFVPVGLVGVLLAGLLAAFMSTFDSTVNAGAAYLVNDIYKRYLNPNATTKRYVHFSYFSSILLVVVAIAVFGDNVLEAIFNRVIVWFQGLLGRKPG